MLLRQRHRARNVQITAHRFHAHDAEITAAASIQILPGCGVLQERHNIPANHGNSAVNDHIFETLSSASKKIVYPLDKYGLSGYTETNLS